MTRAALVGHTGFVGGNLAAQHPFDASYNSKNIEEIPATTVVRLPGLFGPGLKKNAVHDLLHGHELHKVNAAGVYQFYDLNRLWADVPLALDSGLPLVNLATEPVSIREVAAEVFDRSFTNDPGTPPARYDMRSKHAPLYGGRGGYLYDRGQVIDGLRAFVRRERDNGGSR